MIAQPTNLPELTKDQLIEIWFTFIVSMIEYPFDRAEICDRVVVFSKRLPYGLVGEDWEIIYNNDNLAL